MLNHGRKLLFILVLVSVLAGSALVGAAQEWPDLDGQRIMVAALWTGDEQGYFNEVLARFNEKTGANAIYSPIGENLATVLGAQIEGGNPPDIAMLPQPGLVKEYARQGALVPVEDAAGDMVDTYYEKVWRDLGSVDGTLYVVWFKAANKSIMWYNTGIFEEAGVETPETFDELLEVARTSMPMG